MKLSGLALLAFAAFALGCASTQYKGYEDGGTLRIGAGGAKEIVDEVEIWSNGTPPRTYRVLGMVNDKRPKGIIPMAQYKPMIAAVVKKQGGDAAIILAEGDIDAGALYVPGASSTSYQGTARPMGGGAYQMSGTATTYSSPGYAVAVSKQQSTIAIIKYVDAPAPAAERRDENGITAATYRQLADQYDREGNAEMAALARRKAARLQ